MEENTGPTKRPDWPTGTYYFQTFTFPILLVVYIAMTSYTIAEKLAGMFYPPFA